MCRNSFGPCALECGPSTPVIEELRLRELLAEHRHERDRAALAHPHRRLAEVLASKRRRRAFSSQRRGRRRVPAGGGLAVLEAHLRAVGRIVLQQLFSSLRRRLGASTVGGRRSESDELRLRPQHVAGARAARQAVGAGDGERRPPGAVQDQLGETPCASAACRRRTGTCCQISSPSTAAARFACSTRSARDRGRGTPSASPRRSRRRRCGRGAGARCGSSTARRRSRRPSARPRSAPRRVSTPFSRPRSEVVPQSWS